MWIALNDAFLSIVQHEDFPDVLVVRARKREDLLAAFPDSEGRIVDTPSADYCARLFLPRYQVVEFLQDRIRGIDYPNFKDSVSKDDVERADFYLNVWREGMHFQNGSFARRRPWGPFAFEEFEDEDVRRYPRPADPTRVSYNLEEEDEDDEDVPFGTLAPDLLPF